MRCSHARLRSHLSQPRARICTCTDPHTATQAHAPSLSASCGPTGAHPLEARAPVSLLPLRTRDLFAPRCHHRGPSACSVIPALGLLLFHGQAPLMYTYRPVGTLPPSRSLPFPQALSRMQSQCTPLCTRTHASSFSLVHTLSYTGSLSFSSLSLPSTCSFTCSQAPKHIYTFKLTLPPSLCVGVHICKKPGNPADAGASAPSPASTRAGPARNRQLPLGSRSEGGGRRGQRRC